MTDQPGDGFGTGPPSGPAFSGASGAERPPAPPRPDVVPAVTPFGSDSPVSPGSRVWWRPRDAVAVYLMAGGVSLFLGIALRAVPGLRGTAEQAVGGFLQELGFIAIVVWWIRAFGDGRLRILGFPRKPWGDIGSGLGIGVLAVIADVVVAVAVNALVHAVTGHTPHRPPSVTNDLHGAWTVPVAFVAVVMAPLGEETLFRGFILQGLERGLRGPWPIVVSAAFFAFVHVYPTVMPSVFVIGIILALLYRRRRSLLATMTAHATVNLVAVTLTLLQR